MSNQLTKNRTLTIQRQTKMELLSAIRELEERGFEEVTPPKVVYRHGQYEKKCWMAACRLKEE